MNLARTKSAEAKRLSIMLHLAVTTGSVALTLALALTPKGRTMAAGVWGWIKGLFSKASSPRRLLFVVRGKSPKGAEFELGFSSQDTETRSAQGEGSPSTKLLNQLPPAIGNEHLTVPLLPANPETILFMLRLLSNEPPQQPTQGMNANRKRRTSRRVIPRRHASGSRKKRPSSR